MSWSWEYLERCRKGNWTFLVCEPNMCYFKVYLSLSFFSFLLSLELFVWLCFPQPTTISQMKDVEICIQTCPVICHEVTEMQWNTSFNDSWYLTRSLSRPQQITHTPPGLHSCVQQSSWTHTEATVVGSSQFVSTTWCFAGSNNTAFTHQRSNWMAILARSHALCWLEPLACLLSCVSARVTAKLKPLMYYSSAHVRYYSGTGWCGQGAARTAAPRGQEVDTNRPISKLVNRAANNQEWRGRIHNKSLLQNVYSV